MKGVSVFIMTFLLLQSCDKNEQAYNKLLRSGTWQVSELSAGTNNFTKLPAWQISSCADHDNYCSGLWQHDNGSEVEFIWRFTNLGGDFELYPDSSETDTTTMAYAQCLNFSGMYDVIKSPRKKFTFESDQTFGYPNQVVKIVIERYD